MFTPPRYFQWGDYFTPFFSLTIFKVAFEFLQNCICRLEAQMGRAEREGGRRADRRQHVKNGFVKTARCLMHWALPARGGTPHQASPVQELQSSLGSEDTRSQHDTIECDFKADTKT